MSKESTATATATAEVAAHMTYRHVAVDRIDRDPGQPRQIFDPVKLDELAASMKALGQLQAITVRYNKQTRRYTIVAGERRWRAAQQAGIGEMHCLVMSGVDDPTTFAKAMAENLGRVDLLPMEEAQGFQSLHEAGFTVEQIAAMCGKAVFYVTWRMDLLRLVPALQEAVIKGHVPVGVTWYLVNLSADNQHRFLARFARGEFSTSRDAEAFARACQAAEKEQAEQGDFFVTAAPADAAGAASTGAQGGVFDLPAPADAERIAADRMRLVAKINRLSGAASVLAELASMDAAEMATLLAAAPGGIEASRARVDHLKDVAGKAIKTLVAAQAIERVRADQANASITIDPQLIDKDVA
jgi:ParB family chromosome partitioning protein